jgi:hypothetical protein
MHLGGPYIYLVIWWYHQCPSLAHGGGEYTELLGGLCSHCRQKTELLGALIFHLPVGDKANYITNDLPSEHSEKQMKN